jgi:hypothetical protein
MDKGTVVFRLNEPQLSLFCYSSLGKSLNLSEPIHCLCLTHGINVGNNDKIVVKVFHVKLTM